MLPLGFSMSAYYFLPREKDCQAETVLNIMIYNLVAVAGLSVLSTAQSCWILSLHQPGLTGYGSRWWDW